MATLKYLDPRVILSVRECLNVLYSAGASPGDANQAIVDALNDRPQFNMKKVEQQVLRGRRRLSIRGPVEPTVRVGEFKRGAYVYKYVLKGTFELETMTDEEIYRETFVKLGDVLGYVDQGALDENVRLRTLRDESV